MDVLHGEGGEEDISVLVSNVSDQSHLSVWQVGLEVGRDIIIADVEDKRDMVYRDFAAESPIALFNLGWNELQRELGEGTHDKHGSELDAFVGGQCSEELYERAPEWMWQKHMFPPLSYVVVWSKSGTCIDEMWVKVREAATF